MQSNACAIDIYACAILNRTTDLKTGCGVLALGKFVAHAYVPHNGYIKQSESTHILYISMLHHYTKQLCGHLKCLQFAVQPNEEQVVVTVTDPHLENLWLLVLRLLGNFTCTSALYH